MRHTAAYLGFGTTHLPVILALAGVLVIAGPGCQRAAPPPAERSAVPVEVVEVRPDTLAETAVLTGLLEAYRAVDVVCEVTGEIEEIHHDVGDRVDRRTILAAVDKETARESLTQAAAALMAAEARHGLAQADFRRDSTLHQSGDISPAAYEASRMSWTAARADLMSAGAARQLAARQLAETDIRAPFAGYVSRRHCDLGTFVTPGMPVFRIVDVDSLRLRLGVSQRNVARLRVGAEVRITVETLEEQTYRGRIRSIAPEADPHTRTFGVEVVLANPPGAPLRDGLVVRAALVLARRDGVLAVPREAVQRGDESEFVFVVADSVAVRRGVRRGPLIADHYVIEAGLEPGDRVVTVGMQNLRDATPVVIETAYR